MGEETGKEVNRLPPIQFLELLDQRWSPVMRNVSLITECAIKPKEISQAARAFALVRRHDRSQVAIKRVVRRLPAAVAGMVAGVAADAYRSGAFWPGFYETLGITDLVEQGEDAFWGDAFLEALKTLELPSFGELPRKYLGPILMHAGIPDYCLFDYFEWLEQAVRAVGADSDAVARWMNQRSQNTHVIADKPVQRFVENGGVFAVDFIDRTIELLAATSAKDSLDSVRLPERVIGKAVEYCSNARHRSMASTVTSSRLRFSLRLNPFAGHLLLQLPALDRFSAELSWTVHADDITVHLRPALSLGGRLLGADEMAWPLPCPVRGISVSLDELGIRRDIEVVDPSDPVLFFAQSGEWIKRSELPADFVWALYADPDGSRTERLRPQLVEIETPPAGWAGWQLALLNLVEAKSINVTGKPRYVRGEATARLIGELPISWISAGADSVITTRPLVEIPQGVGIAWQVSVIDLSSGKTITTFIAHGQAAPSHHGVFQSDSPCVGRYEITVRGPLGRGFRQRIAIAEGLVVAPSDPWRRITLDGLEPCSLTLSGPGLHPSSPAIHLAANEVSASVLISNESSELQLNLMPHSMAIAIIKNGMPDKWVHGFVRLTSEEASEHQLLIRAPREARGAILRAIAKGNEVQVLRPKNALSNGLMQFDLAQLADAIRQNPSMQLEFELEADRIRACSIAPKIVATGVTINDTRLQLNEFSGGDVQVKAWPVFAPWLGAFSGMADSLGNTALPDRLVGAGMLAVQWWPVDPWVPLELPQWPDAQSCTFTANAVQADAVHPAAVSLATGSECAVPLEVNDAWKLLLFSQHIPQSVLQPQRVFQLLGPLKDRPAESLESLASVSATSAEKVRMLVTSRITECPFETQYDDEAMAQLIGRDRLVGSLCAIQRLCTNDSLRSYPETWSAINRAVGESVQNILVSGLDPLMRIGSFASADQLARMQESQVREILTSTKAVPNALLDQPTRLYGAFEMFLARDSSPLRNSAKAGRDRVEYIKATLRDANLPQLAALVESRHPEGDLSGWRSLSAQSIGLSLLSRLAARGNRFALQAFEMTQLHILHAWINLTISAPNMAIADLILAEAWLARMFAAETPVQIESEAIDEEDHE